VSDRDVGGELAVAPDCGRITAFQGSTFHQPPQGSKLAFGYKEGAIMTSVLSGLIAVCCIVEVAQPPQVPSPVTLLGMADERLLVLRLGMWPNRRVSPTYFEKIRAGITEGEVEKVLRSPNTTEDKSKYTAIKLVPIPNGFRRFRVMRTNSWVGMDQVIVIDFGEKGTVEWYELRPLGEWASVVRRLDTRNDFQKLRDWFNP
jgi:hypothetical protein